MNEGYKEFYIYDDVLHEPLIKLLAKDKESAEKQMFYKLCDVYKCLCRKLNEKFSEIGKHKFISEYHLEEKKDDVGIF